MPHHKHQEAHVGTRLRKLRKEKGLTQTQVTGGQYSKEYVSQVELGKTKPSARALKLFAKYLAVDETYFETGVDRAGRERFENLMVKGQVLTERGEFEDARGCYEEARGLGEKADNRDLVWRAELALAWVLHLFGEDREGLASLSQAREYYEARHPGSLELADAYFRLGAVREALGDLRMSLLLLEQSLKILDRAPPAANELKVRVLRLMTKIHRRHNDLQIGGEAAEAALELSKTMGDRQALADAYWQAAAIEEGRGEFIRATEYGLRARDLLSELGERQESARLLLDLGLIQTRMGNLAEAIAHFEQGLVLVGQGDLRTAPQLLQSLADARAALEQWEAVLEVTAAIISLVEGREEVAAARGTAHLLRARAYLGLGSLAQARLEVEAAREAIEATDGDEQHSTLLLVEGDLQLAEGDPAAAAKSFRRSRELLPMR